jgi:hypothetical protein
VKYPDIPQSVSLDFHFIGQGKGNAGAMSQDNLVPGTQAVLYGCFQI